MRENAGWWGGVVVAGAESEIEGSKSNRHTLPLFTLLHTLLHTHTHTHTYTAHLRPPAHVSHDGDCPGLVDHHGIDGGAASIAADAFFHGVPPVGFRE